MLLSNIDFETSLSNDESGSSFNVQVIICVCVRASVQFIVSIPSGWYLCWRIYVFVGVVVVSISITPPQ